MAEEFLLLNPGPVPVTDRVRRAMDEPMISHRSAEFEVIYERAQDALVDRLELGGAVGDHRLVHRPPDAVGDRHRPRVQQEKLLGHGGDFPASG